MNPDSTAASEYWITGVAALFVTAVAAGVIYVTYHYLAVVAVIVGTIAFILLGPYLLGRVLSGVFAL